MSLKFVQVIVERALTKGGQPVEITNDMSFTVIRAVRS
jgi:hypothetical protein